MTPDGGASFVLAFLPRGGSLVVLGSLERWLWANDGRLRAQYCQLRRDARLDLRNGTSTSETGDCHALAAAHVRKRRSRRRSRAWGGRDQLACVFSSARGPSHEGGASTAGSARGRGPPPMQARLGAAALDRPRGHDARRAHRGERREARTFAAANAPRTVAGARGVDHAGGHDGHVN